MKTDLWTFTKESGNKNIKVKNKMPLDSSKQLSRQEVFLGAWCETAQWAKVLASKPEDSGSVLGTYMVGGDNCLP